MGASGSCAAEITINPNSMMVFIEGPPDLVPRLQCRSRMNRKTNRNNSTEIKINCRIRRLTIGTIWRVSNPFRVLLISVLLPFLSRRTADGVDADAPQLHKMWCQGLHAGTYRPAEGGEEMGMARAGRIPCTPALISRPASARSRSGCRVCRAMPSTGRLRAHHVARWLNQNAGDNPRSLRRMGLMS